MHRFASAVAACALAVLVPAAANAQAQFNMKIGTPTLRGSLEDWGEMVKAAIEKRTAGKMTVAVYPGSQLGAIPRMIEGAQLGTIETVQVPPEFLSGIDDRFSIFSAPGVIRGMWHGYKTLNDPEFKAAFWPVGEPKGIRIVGHNCDSPSDFVSRAPVRKIADLKGLKLRVFGSPIEREMLSRVGATGVPMPLDEVLPAIQRHVIDGNKAGITVFVPFKYYDTVKYVLKAKESVICVTKFLSKGWVDRLPADMRTVVLEETQGANLEAMRRGVKAVDVRYDEWLKAGGTLTEFDADEQKRFYDLIATVADTVLKDKAPALQLLGLLRKSAAKYDDTPL